MYFAPHRGKCSHSQCSYTKHFFPLASSFTENCNTLKQYFPLCQTPKTETMDAQPRWNVQKVAVFPMRVREHCNCTLLIFGCSPSLSFFGAAWAQLETASRARCNIANFEKVTTICWVYLIDFAGNTHETRKVYTVGNTYIVWTSKIKPKKKQEQRFRNKDSGSEHITSYYIVSHTQRSSRVCLLCVCFRV